MRASDQSLTQSQRLLQFLSACRNTISRSRNITPSHLIFGNNLRSRFYINKFDILRNMEYDKFIQKRHHDRSASSFQSFEEGEDILVNNPLGKGSIRAQIIQQTGPLSYLVNANGLLCRHHADQMRKRKSDVSPNIRIKHRATCIT